MRSYKKAFVSKVAAAALAFGMVAGAASAQEGEISGDAISGDISATTTVMQEGAEQIVLSRDFSVAINPLIPIGMIGGMGALYAAFCLFAASRRMRGAWLRAAAGGVIAIALLNPEILEEEREILPTEVVVVIDKSASQSLAGRGEATSAMYEALAGPLSEMGGVNIRIVEVDGNNDGGSNLFSAVEASLTDIPRDRLGAVIMLTDGQVHDIPDPATLELRRGGGAPLHVLLSGQEGERDRRIVIEGSPLFGLVDEERTISFRVIDEGADAGTAGMVRVTASSNGKEVAAQYVMPGEVAELRVNIPHTGANIIELKVEGLEGELTDVNNRAVTSIEGIREALSVLLVSGEPDAGMRMWRDLLKSDPDTDLVHFTILRPPEKQDNTPLKELSLIPFPTHELFTEKLGQFDLIVFDQYKYRGLLPPAYFKNVAEHVKEGGALLVVSGPDYAGNAGLYRTKLSSVLPAAPDGQIIERPYVPAISDAGRRHPVTRNIADGSDNPDWGRWFRIIGTDDNPAGHVVMEGAGDKALLVLSREGEGRVAMLLSDQAWLWARGYEGGGPHDVLLRQTFQWLMANPEFEEEALRLIVRDGNLIVEQQTMADKSAPVTVYTPSGKEITVIPAQSSPGIWRMAVPSDELGLYRAAQNGEHVFTTFINVGPDHPEEFVHILSSADPLRPLVEETGGMIARMSDASGNLVVPEIVRLGADGTGAPGGPDGIGVRMSDASIVKDINRIPLMPGWLGLITVIALLAGAWYREGEGSLFGKNKEPDKKVPAGKEPVPGGDGPSV